MTFEALLAAAGRSSDEQLLGELASGALDQGEEQRALPLILSAAADTSSARLWQWAGLLQRSLDNHAAAMRSFSQAAALSPADPSIAHGRAAVTFEAGLDAVELFEVALRLAPADGQVFLGLAAAKFAIGEGEQAADELDAALTRVPLWIEGHVQLAHFRSMTGDRAAATRSLEQAIERQPQAFPLWKTLFDLHTSSEDFEALERATAAALQAGHAEFAVLPWRAIAVAEQDRGAEADHLFATLPENARAAMSVWQVRHLLRSGRPEQASPIVDAELGSARAAAMWPYASTLWRMTGDSRSSWLECDGIVAVMDLTSDLPPLDTLARTLRALHVARGQYLDQSVRGGTQTDGPLFSRIDVTIKRLRAAVVSAVERYVAQLPPIDAKHPLLGKKRNASPRFSGSWSVRLSGGGRHVNHVHPQGWISSALYVALPSANASDAPGAGWLTLGVPPENVGVTLSPTQMVKPKPGHLVLFPSWMWHGTLPFAAGERLTVAFDVAPPR